MWATKLGYKLGKSRHLDMKSLQQIGSLDSVDVISYHINICARIAAQASLSLFGSYAFLNSLAP